MSNFTHPTVHVIDANTHRVMWHEVFARPTWYGDSEVIVKGEQQYRIIKQQLGVDHYYVWAERITH